MRKISVFLFLFAAALMAEAQVLEPVAWSFRAENKGENNFEIVMTATIDDGWHLYAMDLEEGGPIATSFTFEPVTGYTLNGKAFEVTKPEVKFDNSFGMTIGMHSGTTDFRPQVRLTGASAKGAGDVTFMSCDDKQCLPPRDVEFSLEIKGTGKADATGTSEVKTGNQPAETAITVAAQAVPGI